VTPAAPAHPAEAPAIQRPFTVFDAAAAAAAVFMVLIFSQGWIMPLVGETVDAAAGGMVRNMYFPAYAAGLAYVALNGGDILKVLARQPFLILLSGLAIASVAWSISPSETVRRTVAVSFTTFAGVVLAARYRWRELAELLALSFAILCVFSFLLGLLVPRLGVMSEIFPGAWRGLWPEKNALGNNMALFFPAFAAAAILSPRRAPIWWGFAGLCLLLLVLSTSKTSLVATLIAMAGVAFVVIVQRGPILALLATYAGILGVVALASLFLFASDMVFDLLGKDATFTGRTEIWSAILMEVEKRPWLGHGYGTVWTEQGTWGTLVWIVKHAGFKPIHAHSSWMEMLLWLGWVGLIAWLLFFAQTLIAAFVAVFRDRGAVLAFPFVLAYAVISITESVTLTYNDLRWVVFVALACKLAYPDRLQARD
jgi:O-antigen ligase